MNESFFQIDLGMAPEALSFLPNNLQHRFLIDFRAIGNVSWKTINQTRQWMREKWAEIPPDGVDAFLSRFILHIKTQKVSLGEISSTISFKVKMFDFMKFSYTFMSNLLNVLFAASFSITFSYSTFFRPAI